MPRRRSTRRRVLIAPIVMTVIVAAVTFGLTRFREPAELSVLVLAAITLDALATAFSARRTRRAGPDPAST